MRIDPYLSLEGRAEEAIEFYRAALGAEVVTLLRFSDAPAGEPSMVAPGTANKVMHAALRIGESTLMVSDGRCQGGAAFQGITLTISARDAAEVDRLFAALSNGGQVQMPLTETFFSPRFGMTADRFGVNWMVTVAK